MNLQYLQFGQMNSNTIEQRPVEHDFFQYEQWQRPPSRQKEPNQAQYLDDNEFYDPQAQTINNYPQGGRPKIDFFNRHAGPNDYQMQYAAYGAQRPPSRHKEPNQNLGLDLPLDDAPYVDDDSDSSNGFEVCMDNAGYSKDKRRDSGNSFDRDDVIEINDDLNMNDFLNNSGNKRGNSKIVGKNGSENKNQRHLMLSAHPNNKFQNQEHSTKN